MHDHPHRTVVAQRQQLLSRCITRIPCAQRGGGFVGKHYVILCVIKDSLCLVLLFTCGKTTRSIVYSRLYYRKTNEAYRTERIPSMSKRICSLLPVVPAPVYAIRHLLVDNSHNFINESFPEDSKYWNPKLYDYSIRLTIRCESIIFHDNLTCSLTYESCATLPSELLPCRSS